MSSRPAAKSNSERSGGSTAARSRVGARKKAGADPNPPVAARRELEGDTAAEHKAQGRAIRDEVPSESFGHWAPAADRPDPVALLTEQDASRLKDLVPIRHGRMLKSAFTFYRGGAAIMAADLARMPTSGIYVQACGDAHLSNFGLFATPERTMAFDVNDFDETHPAPFEWDLMRLAASLVIAADDNSLGRKDGRTLATHAARRYREQIRALSGMSFLDVWYSHVDVRDRAQEAQQTYSKAQRKRAQKSLSKAQRKTNTGALDRLAERVDGKWRIKDDPPLIVHAELTAALAKRLSSFFEQYVESLPLDLLPLARHYEVMDFARKVVGVGSVGMEAYVTLLIGTRKDDALFLQMKEATTSVLAPYTEAKAFAHEGERVVVGQRLMQASSDLFLGFARSRAAKGTLTDFYVRQLNDYKASAEIVGMDTMALHNYAEVCAEALARAHARSGSAMAISGYLGKSKAFDKAIGSFAVAYADQNTLDYREFEAAAKVGTIQVQRGV